MIKYTGFAFLIIMMISCQRHVTKNDSFLKFLNQNIKGDTGIIDLRNYNSIKWDHFYILNPYVTENNLTSELKKYNYIIDDAGIRYNEGNKFLYFFEKTALYIIR